MTYPKCYKDNGGVILVDVLLALSVSALFVGITAHITLGARDLFERARTRAYLIDLYEQYKDDVTDVQVYENRTVQISETERIEATKVPYGNERTETIVTVSSSYSQPLSFVSVSSQSGAHIQSSDSLCSVRFSDSSTIGSYKYISERNTTGDPAHVAAQVHIRAIRLPLPPALPLTDIIVQNGTAYISADSASASDDDLFVLNISSTTSSYIKGSINTGPGIAAIALAGEYVYAAAASSAFQLHTIRVDKTGSLSLKNRYQLPLPYATATPAVGTAIAFNDGRIFLGTEKWAGQEMLIFDAALPSEPNMLGSLEIGSKNSKMLITNGLLMVAAAGEHQLLVSDISNERVPVLVSAISPRGWQRQEGKVFSYFENTLRFGRTSGGFNIVQDHELFGWSSSTQLSALGLPGSYSQDNGGGVYGIISDRHFDFVAGRELGKELQIISRNFTSSVAVPLPDEPRTIVCDGDSIFALAKNSPTLFQISFNHE
jgi:hypothetical protein